MKEWNLIKKKTLTISLTDGHEEKLSTCFQKDQHSKMKVVDNHYLSKRNSFSLQGLKIGK